MAVEHLRARLAADNRLQLAYQKGIRMRTHGRADGIVRAVGIGNPVTQGFVDRRTQGLITTGHRYHGGAQQFHAIDIRRLPLDVDRTHVHRAGHAEARGRGCARHTMLAGAGLGDHSLGAQALREQGLSPRRC